MFFSNRVRTSLAAGRLFLVAAIAAGLIPSPASAQASRPEATTSEQLAQEPQPRRKAPRPARKTPDPEAMRREQQEFIESVAGKLGVSPERLNAAIRDARLDRVNKAVVEGKLSREQADRMIERMSLGPDPAEPAPPGAAAPVKPDSRGAAGQVAPPISDITVSFKLDPRLTKGLYMGERWVSPPTYTGGQQGNEFTVEARAHGRAKGGLVDISPRWIPSDPDMVAVSPGRGRDVKITVQRAGESTLEVASQEVSKKLSIKAWYQGNALQAEISQ